MKIQALSKDLVHRIAAGEVVERPSSALKELVENSLDAGAKRIKVSILDGGFSLLEVEDDGCGLSYEDLKQVAERHATSKISQLDDLDNIVSLGFRGEALSAISSVARVEIDSLRSGESCSYKIDIIGGVKSAPQSSARSKGTCIRVFDLFFNIPARRKFLKKPALEAAECVDVLENLSLSYPDVSFEWYVLNNGEVKAQKVLSPSSSQERYCDLLRIAGDFLVMTAENPSPGVKKVEVIALKPPQISRFQKSIKLIVNGRVVYDKRLPFSMREAFVGLIEPGAFPYALIRADLDPSMIDVNVHPQKKEIRWPIDFSIASHVYHVVKKFLDGQRAYSSPTQSPQAPSSNDELGRLPEFSVPSQNLYARENAEMDRAREAWHSPSLPGSSLVSPLEVPSFPRLDSARQSFDMPNFQEAVAPFLFSQLRPIGECSASWLLCESSEGLVVIDQHAAHERIQFERILESRELLRSRPLLLPLDIKLPLGVEATDQNLRTLLNQCGFELNEDCSLSDTLEINAVPESDRKIDWKRFFDNLFEKVKGEESLTSLLESLKVKLASSLACHGSVRRGQRLHLEQIKELLHQMDQVKWGGLCPHGRPVWFLLSNLKIEETFHR